MTIAQYLKSIPNAKTESGQDLKEIMLNNMPIWDNDACRGYCIQAMQDAGIDKDKIKDVLDNIRICFDDITVEDAGKIFLKFK